MGIDIEKIALSLRQVHEVWASIIEIASTLWLLEKQMDAAFVAPAILAIGLSLYLWSVSHLADLYDYYVF